MELNSKVVAIPWRFSRLKNNDVKCKNLKLLNENKEILKGLDNIGKGEIMQLWVNGSWKIICHMYYLEEGMSYSGGWVRCRNL